MSSVSSAIELLSISVELVRLSGAVVQSGQKKGCLSADLMLPRLVWHVTIVSCTYTCSSGCRYRYMQHLHWGTSHSLFLCVGVSNYETPSTKVMQKICFLYRPQTSIRLQATPVCVHMLASSSTDLSNIEGFQTSVLLQDKELVPHPTSLHPLEMWWTSFISLLCWFTQKTVRQEGQNAKGHSEQSACKMQMVSHCETQSSVGKEVVVFWLFPLWLL